MSSEKEDMNKQDENLKKDFKIAQYIYIALYLALVISLIFISMWYGLISLYNRKSDIYSIAILGR